MREHFLDHVPGRLQTTFALVLVALAAAGAYVFAAVPDGPCFTAGPVAYRMAASAWSPDYRVRIGGPGTTPDLRIRLVETADSADVVLVDDPDTADHDSCRGARTLKTVQIVTDDRDGAVKVELVRDESADFRLFLRSRRFSVDDGAALLAAMANGRKTHDLAAFR